MPARKADMQLATHQTTNKPRGGGGSEQGAGTACTSVPRAQTSIPEALDAPPGGGDSAGPRTPTTPPPPPPSPPQGAFGQQLVGGVVGVQNRGVAPPGDAPHCRGLQGTASCGFLRGDHWPGFGSENPGRDD